MQQSLRNLVLGIASAGLMTLYGCGGGGTGNSVSTVDVPVTVIDGPIQNAQVCLDKNNNGSCDAGEPVGKTGADGKVTLKVDSADSGKYPVIAVVGTDAIDADTGSVPEPFTLKAPADKPSVVTPLTTLVHNHMESTGATSSQAETLVKKQTGINVSLFEDFSKGSTEDHKAAANVARMVVVTTQQQSKALKDAVDDDSKVIPKADLDKAIQKKLMEMLPKMVELLSDPGVQAAIKTAQDRIDNSSGSAKKEAQDAKDKALQTKATEVIAEQGLTKAGIALNVAINKQLGSTPAAAAETPAATFNLRSLSFTDVKNYYYRFVSGTAAQNAPDTQGKVKYVYNRYKSVDGVVAAWNAGSTPARQADLHWNGSNWVACQLNFESVATTRDAKGYSEYDYCDKLEIGKSNRASIDISGKKMVDTLDAANKAGYTNLGTITDGIRTVLGDAVFPEKSFGAYINGTTTDTAIAYHPGSDNWVIQYSKAVSDGGDSTKQAVGEKCNSKEFSGDIPTGATGGPTYSTTIEGMIAAVTGTPCTYAEGGFTYDTVVHKSGTRNEAWGATTVSLGNIGDAPLNTGAAPGFYTTNTKLRAAFKGAGSSEVTYYACKERFTNGSTRNCDAIGTGTYNINTVGDARTLSFNSLPAMASALSYTRVFVERNGKVYFGYQSRPTTSNSASLNTVASAAVLAKLGLPTVSVDEPLELTQASYQGTWDAYPDKDPTKPGATFTFNDKGQVLDKTGVDTISITSFNAATGVFVWKVTGTDGYISDVTGKLDFLTGTGTASYANNRNESGTAKFVRR